MGITLLLYLLNISIIEINYKILEDCSTEHQVSIVLLSLYILMDRNEQVSAKILYLRCCIIIKIHNAVNLIIVRKFPLVVIFCVFHHLHIRRNGRHSPVTSFRTLSLEKVASIS